MRKWPNFSSFFLLRAVNFVLYHFSVTAGLNNLFPAFADNILAMLFYQMRFIIFHVIFMWFGDLLFGFGAKLCQEQQL